MADTSTWQWQGSRPSEQAAAISSGIGGFVTPLINGLAASRANSGTASSLLRESSLYLGQGKMMMASGRAYASSAKSAIKIGKYNARNDRLLAARVDPMEQRQLEEAILERRAKVGLGLTGAAANGILLESRSDAAVAMWEQDEAADLAYEQTLIMQQAEDTVWNLRMSANQKEAEGYGQAAGLYGQAASAAASAWQSFMQASNARQDALEAQRQAKKSKKNGIVQALSSVAGTGFGAIWGPAGALIGGSVGNAVGAFATA